MAYNISKTLAYSEVEISSPLGVAQMNLPAENLVVGTILRAGLPMHQGFLNYFDRAECAFVSAYRKYDKSGEFDVQVEYLSAPDLTDKTLILVDPMIATGASMVLTYKALIAKGIPRHIHIVAAIGSQQGLSYVKQKLPTKTSIWVAAIDKELTARAYIVPGLGDAGDLAFGKKD